MMEFYNHVYPRARKNHTCEYCREMIGIGQKYSYETGKYDGDLFARKLCMTCSNILNEYLYANSETDFTWDEIEQWLQDGFCYDCEHGPRQDDDCDCFCCNCPQIREKFKE